MSLCEDSPQTSHVKVRVGKIVFGQSMMSVVKEWTVGRCGREGDVSGFQKGDLVNTDDPRMK
jgi:hypothetical protein